MTTTGGGPGGAAFWARAALGGGGGGGMKFWWVKPPNVIGKPKSSKKPSVTPYTFTCCGVPSGWRSVRSIDCMPAARTMEDGPPFSGAISPFESMPVVTRPSVNVVRML